MDRRRVILGIGAVLLALACVDSTGPPIEKMSLGDIGLVASVAGDDGSSVEPRILKQADHMPLLETYTVSFWAVRGETRSATIRYRASAAVGDEDDEARGDIFLSLEIPRRALRRYPDGSKIAKGDAVLITITVDPTRFLLTLQPTGLVFSRKHPARLFISYAGAVRDFDFDGDVDEVDEFVEAHHLGLWSQEQEGDPWYPYFAVQSLADRWFLGLLRHFSGHVISW